MHRTPTRLVALARGAQPAELPRTRLSMCAHRLCALPPVGAVACLHREAQNANQVEHRDSQPARLSLLGCSGSPSPSSPLHCSQGPGGRLTPRLRDWQVRLGASNFPGREVLTKLCGKLPCPGRPNSAHCSDSCCCPVPISDHHHCATQDLCHLLPGKGQLRHWCWKSL